jgi:glycosyltransferase involved in cell wall biosynthesis
MDIFVIGRFPPPLDGQSLATKRLAELLTPAWTVQRLNTSIGAAVHVQADVRFSPAKVRHYFARQKCIRDGLAERPEVPVLWASISPAPLGHLRDVLTVLPTFHPDQKVYAIIHWGNFDRVFRHPLTAITARRMVHQVSGFVFLSEMLAERCARWIPDAKRLVIPNTIDATVLCTDEEIAAKHQRHRSPLRLLFLSNMIASKGYLDVLHGVRLLHARGIPVQADFAGGWTSEAERIAFDQIVAGNDLQDVVTHHGSVSDRSKIQALYLDADVFLLPTYYPTEAQPLTIIEALNAGTPVVTTRHAAIPDMVRHDQEALFVAPRSPEAIADAVAHLADSTVWQAFSRRARQRFEARFSPETVRQQWEALLVQSA